MKLPNTWRCPLCGVYQRGHTLKMTREQARISEEVSALFGEVEPDIAAQIHAIATKPRKKRRKKKR